MASIINKHLFRKYYTIINTIYLFCQRNKTTITYSEIKEMFPEYNMSIHRRLVTNGVLTKKGFVSASDNRFTFYISSITMRKTDKYINHPGYKI